MHFKNLQIINIKVLNPFISTRETRTIFKIKIKQGIKRDLISYEDL